MTDQQQPLIIKDWQNAVANSPHLGHALMRNVDIESFPGAVKVSKKPRTFFPSGNTRTFTADAATDICTASGSIEANNLYDGMAVYFTSTGTLPAGLSLNTVYFLIQVSATTFKVASSYKNAVGSAAGTAINITDAGTGTHTIRPIVIGTIRIIIRDPASGYYYQIDSNGRVWFIPAGATAYLLLNAAIESPSGALTNASGMGMVLFRTSDGNHTYLLTYRNAVIDVLEVTGNTAIEALSWSNAWQSLNSGSGVSNSHESIVGQDNIIYFCDARFVGSIQEKPGSVFDPANAATYTYNNQALDFPQGEIAQCFEELGTNLLTGGNTYNKIYPWDRVSDSFQLPLAVPEYGIKRMKNIGSTVYILAGTNGNIYSTQGTFVKFVRQVPVYITNNEFTITSNPVAWGGIGAVNGNLLFGLAGLTTGSSGIYIMYPDGRIVQDNTPSIGSTNVVGLYATNTFYLMGYAGGSDNFDQAVLYSNFESILHSALYRVGNKVSFATYSRLEIQIAKPAATGHIRIKYRRDESSAFADFATAVSATCNGSDTSFSFDIGLTDIENLQLQAEMDGLAELMEVRLYP